MRRFASIRGTSSAIDQTPKSKTSPASGRPPRTRMWSMIAQRWEEVVARRPWMRRLAIPDARQHVDETRRLQGVADAAGDRVLIDVAAHHVGAATRRQLATSERASRSRFALLSLSRWMDATRMCRPETRSTPSKRAAWFPSPEIARSRKPSLSNLFRLMITAVPFGAHGISGTSQLNHQSGSF